MPVPMPHKKTRRVSFAKLKFWLMSPCTDRVSCFSLAHGSSHPRPQQFGPEVPRPAAQQWQTEVLTMIRFVTEGESLARILASKPPASVRFLLASDLVG